jgi:hypothetical protein
LNDGGTKFVCLCVARSIEMVDCLCICIIDRELFLISLWLLFVIHPYAINPFVHNKNWRALLHETPMIAIFVYVCEAPGLPVFSLTSKFWTADLSNQKVKLS